jgi:hypothetical protein
MMIGTLHQAQQLLAKMRLAADVTLSQMDWMGTRVVDRHTSSQRTYYFYAEKSKVDAAMKAAACREYLQT